MVKLWFDSSVVYGFRLEYSNYALDYASENNSLEVVQLWLGRA